MIKRRQYSERTECAGIEIGQRNAGCHRAGVAIRSDRFTRKTHDPAHRLRNEVEATSLTVRTAVTKPRYRAINKLGIDRLEVIVAEPKPVERARTEIFDKDIGSRCKLADHFDRRGLMEIKADGALVPVHEVERFEGKRAGAAIGFATDWL